MERKVYVSRLIDRAKDKGCTRTRVSARARVSCMIRQDRKGGDLLEMRVQDHYRLVQQQCHQQMHTLTSYHSNPH